MMDVLSLQPPSSVLPANIANVDFSQLKQPEQPVVSAWQSNFNEEAANVCVHRLQRMDQIMRYIQGKFDILETMNPADFLEFRDYIGPYVAVI